MNKSIIESIYNADRIFYDENIDTEEFYQAKKQFCENYEKLLETLNEQQQKLFDEVFCLHENMHSIGYIKKFKDGFLLGFNLAEEILNSD